MKILDSEKGAVLLFTVLVVGLAAVAMMTVLAVSGLNSKVDSNQEVFAAKTRAHLNGCKEEVLVQFNNDPNYSSTSVNTLDATCTVAVTNLGGDNRSATISFTEVGITRSVYLEFSVNEVNVTLVREQ